MAGFQVAAMLSYVVERIFICSWIRAPRLVSWILIPVVKVPLIGVIILSWTQRSSAAIVMVHIPLNSSSSHWNLRQLLHIHLSSVRSVLGNLVQLLWGPTSSTTAVPISFKISVNIILLLIAAMGSKVTVWPIIFIFTNYWYFLVRWIHFVIYRGTTELTALTSHSV